MKRVLLVILTLSLAACLQMNAAFQQPATPTPQPTSATLEPVGTSEPVRKCTVTATALHIRSGPGVSYPVTGYLLAGDVVTIESQRGAWYQTGRGWIHTHYCEKE